MYQVELSKAARKVYLKLPNDIRAIIYEKLNRLAQAPYVCHTNVKRLQGISDAYRLRVNDWRVLYRIQHKILIIEVIKIGHRKEVYR